MGYRNFSGSADASSVPSGERSAAASLTTVHIHTQAMGQLAAELLLDRIAEPDRPPRTTYSLTDLIRRESSSM